MIGKNVQICYQLVWCLLKNVTISNWTLHQVANWYWSLMLGILNELEHLIIHLGSIIRCNRFGENSKSKNPK